MKQYTLSFYECEHEGDLDERLIDLQNSGAKIISSDINEDAEVGEVVFEVEDVAKFREAFKKTESYELVN